ncbi:hypothetical protein [Marinicella litoralis]|nr:hypothetical protein [Marinicella litoralis]
MKLNMFKNKNQVNALTLLILCLMSPISFAAWPTGGGGSGEEQSVAIVTSSSGSTYSIGQFEGTVLFGDHELNSSGLSDIYVIKINPNGSVAWAVKAGGPSEDIATSITVDDADNVYIGGSHYGITDFGGETLTTSNTVKNGFVAKINASGSFVWAEKVGRNGYESSVTEIKSIEGDGTMIPPIEGSVFISGYYRQVADFGTANGSPLGSTSFSTETSDLFVARLEHDGDWKWVRNRGGASTYAEKTVAMDVDDNGRVYLFGESGGTLDLYEEDFESTALNTIPTGWEADFIGSCIHGVWPHNTPGNNTKKLEFAGRRNGSATPYINTTGMSYVNVSFHLWEGQDSFSEDPDAGEDFDIYYFSRYSGWQFLQRYYGGGSRTNQVINYTFDAAQASHANFRMGFVATDGSGDCWDYWHVDDIKVTSTIVPQKFALEISNTLDVNPTLSSSVALNPNLEVSDIAYSKSNDSLIVSGVNTQANNSYCSKSLKTGSFLASLDMSASPSFSCDWVRYPTTDTNSVGQGITIDDVGNIYQIGTFTGDMTYAVDNQCLVNPAEDETISTANANSDVFLVSFNEDGVACWLTGGDYFDEIDSYPAIIGELEVETGVDVSTNGLSELYITGDFQSSIVFGLDERFNGMGETDTYIQRWGTDGRPFQVEAWPIGKALNAPNNAYLDSLALTPDFYREGVQVDAIGSKMFYWAGPVNGEKAKLIPLKPFEEIEVHWRVSSTPGDSNRVITSGTANWPNQICGELDENDDLILDECYQVHIATTPVEVEPASGDYLLLDLAYAGGSAAVDNRVFNNYTSGFSTLVYINGPAPDIIQYPVEFEVVRTIPFSSAPKFEDAVPWTIGTKVEDTYHNEIGRTGYVLNTLAFYDGVGTSAAYNRGARTGQIIPVNRIETSRPQDVGRELTVAWYHSNIRGVYWPDKAVRYNPQWPFDPDKIIIASQQGGEVLGQEPLDPLNFPSVSLYIQDNPLLPGFNPNDEHAIFAPSNTGSGVESVFALRADFGNKLNGDDSASSDPYVLVKYYDELALEWKFRIYEVMATGAGFNNFQFTGVAATTVSPPYPVRLLPSCAESKAVGQAAGEQPPPPFFQDYKAQIWAKSSGSGELMYYYPLQPGFFFDLDNNDLQDDIDNNGEPDLDTTCVPWLARLSEEEGGTANPTDPIKVRYDITWPTDVPQLVIGETLLKPKRGLPNITDQAAVEVVYDDLYNSLAEPLPSDTLAQMIDPLSPRFVYLDDIPETIASQLETTGFKSISGSADGTIKLSAAIKKRISFDPLNDKLLFAGLFDDTGAGEPLLIPNVISKNDRVQLKKLNGGDGTEESNFSGECGIESSCSWDQAIEALFRYTRNPNRIERICTSSQVLDGTRVCQASNPVTADDVLIGFQDANNDYVLEPFQAVGIKGALTAGSAQGSGFMTIAFNNDPSLTPLPVSLNIIRVDCLVSPLPPAVPDIYKSYQGQLQVIAPENIFDEQIVLRHSGDFGGNPDALEFEWFFHPDDDGTPPEPLPNPANGQLNGWIKYPVDEPLGANEITIAGANIQTLSDNWYVARYRGLPACNNATEWSLWAGQPGGTPLDERAQLAEGWVKRVLKRLNPFEARVQNFAQAATNNYASMLVQLGKRYEGDIAMNNDPDNLNSIGLIEAYTTVMRRAMALSVDSTPPVNYGPANKAILLVASRLVDFYTLLGNEAYADAQDPMIGISTEGGTFTLAPTIFNFQNQLDSLLSEELHLLRGRDDSQSAVTAQPAYNRLLWNFTTGDGEVAYALSYNIYDVNDSGVIDEFDAKIQYPQGHGDAWGHYLTATDIYYDLLRHPFYTWEAKAEAITIAGQPTQVDFLDERQFVETAAAKARVGAEVVDLTYRSAYVEDPSGQYQGYVDSDEDRAWGVSGWARRAGMGAYFDWVTANAIIPAEDNDPDHTGIEKIERKNILGLNEMVSHFIDIQGQIDEADRGLNPLGLASGVVPFDIDPDAVDRGETHFEQVYQRAEDAMTNLVDVWDFANQITNMMRLNQDGVEDISRDARFSENDFNNRLIEIFGLPYDDDIGPGGTYPAGYSGPDWAHYMYIDAPALAGTEFDFTCTEVDADGNCSGYDPDSNTIGVVKEFTGTFSPASGGINFFDLGPADANAAPPGEGCDDNPLGQGCALGELDLTDSLDVKYRTVESADLGFAFAKPESWTGSRRAVGKLQEIQNEMVQARVNVRKAMIAYDILRQDVADAIDGLQATFNITENTMDIANDASNEIQTLNDWAFGLNTAAAVGHMAAEVVDEVFADTAKCIPRNTIAGLAGGGDFLSGAVCGIEIGGTTAAFAIDKVSDGLEIAASSVEFAAEKVASAAEDRIVLNENTLELYDVAGEIGALVRKEPALRAEIYSRAEAAQQLIGKYNTTLTQGLQVMEQLASFRRQGSAAIQEYRYEDMAFRIFRNDALQKYRAAFDQAAKYVYLAASAYDYDTNLLGSDAQGGQGFLTDIVRERSIGQILNNAPVAGSRGLADPMARMKLNFDVLKGQMGFNNPQVETNRFSLRYELFRIADNEDSDDSWRALLEDNRVDNLWDIPEFRRYARPFADETAGPQPAIVLTFNTSVLFGLNFFGNELGPNDSAYDSSQFSTRIRGVGTWFEDYAPLPLANTPRMYLFPVGPDMMRSPAADNFSVREWQILDQTIPVPLPLGANDLDQFDWLPSVDNQIGDSTQIRRYSQYLAHHYSEPFDQSQIISSSRLIGRSVWNGKWMMIIPGASFLNDPDDGLDTFINGQLIPGGGGDRDGNGVSDIHLFFTTYSYSGN